MNSKIVSGMTLALLLIGTLTLAFNVAHALVQTRENSAQPDQRAYTNSWPMFRHDNMRTGFTEDIAPTINKTLWTYHHPVGWIVTSPIVVNGRVFIGDQYSELPGPPHILALNESTRELLWSQDLSSAPWTPAVSNGRVICGTIGGFVYSLEASDGTIAWSKDLASAIDSSPAISEGLIYVGTLGGEVFALNETDGDVIWHKDIGYECALSPALAYDMLFIDVMDHPAASLCALDKATGNLIWRFNYTRSFGFPRWWQQVPLTSPTVSNGKVYTGADGFYCLNATSGEIVWQNTTIYAWSSPSVHDDRVFFGGSTGWHDDQCFYAFDQDTGELVWRHQFNDLNDVIFSSPAIAAEITFMASHGSGYGSKRSYVYALNETSGHQVWSYDTTDEETMTSPAVSGGKLFVTTPHYVLAFGKVDVYTLIDETKTEIEELGLQGEIANRGIVRSLVAKLNVAQKLVDKGKVDEARIVLENFIIQVQNLSGIHITPEEADILIESAEYIISNL